MSFITLIKQEFCVLNDVILIYLRYLHGYNASPDAHLSNTLVTFNRPTVCNIAHKNLDFFQLLLKKKSQQFSTGWPPMYKESPGAECELSVQMMP